MNHPVSGPIKQLQFHELLEYTENDKFRQQLAAWTGLPDVEGIAVFEVLQLDSSCLGMRTFRQCKPNSPTSVENLSKAETRTGDVPSRFGYPVAVYIKPTTVNGPQNEDQKNRRQANPHKNFQYGSRCPG